MMRLKRIDRSGFTLVEVILAMAILAIVVMLIIPPLISAFRMVILAGDRQRTEKSVVGNMENILGGQTVTETLSDIQVVLPGNIPVDGSKFLLSENSKIGSVDLFGYLVKPIPFQEPTGTSPDVTPIPTPTPEATPTPDPLVTPTPSPTPEPTPIPSEPPFDLTKASVDVSRWTESTHQYGNLILPASLLPNLNKLEYRVVLDKSDNVVQDWHAISSLNTQITFSDNTQSYSVILRQTTNFTNTYPIYIRRAPQVYYYYPKNNKVSFKIYLYLQYVDIESYHYVQRFIGDWNTGLGSWNTIPSDFEANDNQIDEANILVRFDASLNADGVTIKDPPSFPAKVIGMAP